MEDNLDEELERIRKTMDASAQIVKNINARANSFVFRYGGTGSEYKIYYEDAENLLQQLKEIESKSDGINSAIVNIKLKMVN